MIAIATAYTAALAPSHLGSPVMVYQARRYERARVFTYNESGRLAEQPVRRAVRTPRVTRRSSRKGRRS